MFVALDVTIEYQFKLADVGRQGIPCSSRTFNQCHQNWPLYGQGIFGANPKRPDSSIIDSVSIRAIS